MSIVHKVRTGLRNYWLLYARQQPPTAIYTAGRVGSTALYESLQKAGVLVFKPERMADPDLRAQHGNVVWFYNHVVAPQRPAKIIGVVRDPMAQMMTEYFNKLHWVIGEQKAWENYSIPQLVDFFNTLYFEQQRHLDKLQWFDIEFGGVLGVDVYAHPKPENGYVQFQQAPYDVLILQLEMDNDTRSQVIGDFLGLKNFQIQRSNTSEAKPYGEVYDQFKREVVVTPQNLETVYGSKFMQHFYDPATIEKMQARWSGELARV